MIGMCSGIHACWLFTVLTNCLVLSTTFIFFRDLVSYLVSDDFNNTGEILILLFDVQST